MKTPNEKIIERARESLELAARAMDHATAIRRHPGGADLTNGEHGTGLLGALTDLHSALRALVVEAVMEAEIARAPVKNQAAESGDAPKETITLTIPVRVLECLWAGGNYSTATLPLADAVAMNALCHAAWMADLLWKSEAADDRNHYGAFQLEMAEELIAAIRKAETVAR